MNSRYNRLVCLAEELDAPFTSERVAELNSLFASLSADEIRQEHFSLLDGLISILLNTGNAYDENHDDILMLQDEIRSRA